MTRFLENLDMRTQILGLLLAVGFASFASTAPAKALKWNYAAEYSDGSAATGSFYFDTHTNQYSEIRMEYFGNGTYSDAVFDSAANTANEFGGIFYDSGNGPNLAGSVSLFIKTFPISLGNTNFLNRSNFVTDIAQCSNDDCTGQSRPFVTSTQKSLIGQLVPVPLPATLPGLGAGLIFLLGASRLRKTQAWT
ncbi:MAG: hypothetical protein AAGF94_13380 [Pseudomonadota bacterium]